MCVFSGLSRYRDVFGAPGTGVHSVRVFDLAIVDVLLTVVLAWLVYVGLRGGKWSMCFPCVLVGAFVVGVAAHAAFGVQTTVHKFLVMLVGFG